MDQLRRFAIFHAVVEAGSFTKAAHTLGLAKSAVSTQIRRLEEDLGAQLLNRSTRKLSLTEAGEELFEAAGRIVAEANTARHRIHSLREHPIGTLRIGTSIGFGTLHLIPALSIFKNAYPEIAYEIVLEDRRLDLIEDKLDLLITFGAQRDSEFVVHRFSQMGWAVCAAASYFERRSPPKEPADLANHEWLFSATSPRTTWTFARGSETQTVRVVGSFRTNSILGMYEALRNGMGIGAIARSDFLAEICAGSVTSVLDDWSLPPLEVVALISRKNRELPKVRLAIDFLSEHWADLS